jgi:hypothetical protein
MDLSNLATLKRKLVEATEFSTVWEYFLDHFGESAEFYDQGSLVRHPMVEAVLEQICRQFCGQRLKLDQLRLIWIAEFQFLHGSTQLGDKTIGVLYFEELNKGMACIAPLPGTGVRTDFMRFSAAPLPKDWSPTLN